MGCIPIFFTSFELIRADICFSSPISTSCLGPTARAMCASHSVMSPLSSIHTKLYCLFATSLAAAWTVVTITVSHSSKTLRAAVVSSDLYTLSCSSDRPLLFSAFSWNLLSLSWCDIPSGVVYPSGVSTARFLSVYALTFLFFIWG